MKKSDINSSELQGKFFVCKKCGYRFAKLLNNNTIVLYGKKGEQFIINFARVYVVCPNEKCGAQQVIESPLVDEIVKMIAKTKNINVKSKSDKNKLKLNADLKILGLESFRELNKIFPAKDIILDPVWTKRFANLLPELQQRAYRIMVDNFDGEVWNPKVLKTIEKELALTKKESEKLYTEVLRKIGKVKGYEIVDSDNLFDFIRQRWWDSEK